MAGIRGTDRKRQQLACPGVRFRSGVTKEQRWPQVKRHAGGSLAAGQDSDFFFYRKVHLGANRGIFAFARSDGNDFAWFAHVRHRRVMQALSVQSFLTFLAAVKKHT
ncbi:MAG: hypothetical protein ACJ746_28910, partial [Bryobacteraceae bacterium]